MKNLIGIVLVLLTGVAQASEHFLNAAEIASLKPHADIPGVSHHVTPGKDPSAYTKIIVGSVTMYFAEESKAKDISADEMTQVSDAMKAALVSAAAGQAEVVLTAGPQAVLINVAITEVNMQKKKRGLLGFTPVGIVVTAAKDLADLRLNLKSARIEGEAVDSVSGEVISVFRIEDIGNWDDKKALSWEDVRGSLEASVAKGIAASR